MPDKHIAFRVRDNLKIFPPDDVFKIRNTSTEIGIVMLVDKCDNRRGIDTGLEDLHDDGREVRPASAIDHNGLVAVNDKIRIAMQTCLNIIKANPVDSLGQFDRSVIVKIEIRYTRHRKPHP